MMSRLLPILLLLWAMPAWSATYYVSKVVGASDSNACTSPGASACATIAGGAGKMSPGDTLLIQAGTYDERMTYSQGFPWQSGTGAGARTRYARYQNDTVIIRPTTGYDHLVSTFNMQYIDLDGLILDGNNRSIAVVKFEVDSPTYSGMRLLNSEVMHSQDVPSGNCVLTGGNATEIRNNRIHDCIEYGVYLTSHDSLVEGNTIYNNGGFAIHHYADEGGVSNNVLRSNVIYGNGFGSFYVTGDPATFPAVILSSGSNSQFYNNVIYQNWAGIQVQWNNPTGMKIYQNTLYANSGDCMTLGLGNVGRPTGTIIRNNICVSNGGGIIDQGISTVQSNNLVASSLAFVAPGSGDFHLQASATTAIDQGADLTSVGITTDLEGVTRPQGSAYDIGAYEYTSGEPPPNPPPAGLQAWWKGNGPSDSTGNGHTLTLNGGMLTNGAPIIGSDATFVLDGVNDYATAAQDIAFRPTDLLCISAWLKSSASAYAYLLDTLGYGLWHDPSGGLHGYIMTSGGLAGVASAGVNVLNNTQTHVVFTKDTQGLRLYVNGAQVGFTATTASISYTGTPPVYLGRNATAAQEFFAGQLAYVRVYNDACSAATVGNLYAEQLPASGVSLTHMAWTQAHSPQGTLLGAIDTDRSQTLSEPVGVLMGIENAATAITEHFPLACCNVASCASDASWMPVTNTANSVGVRVINDSVLNMGDSTSSTVLPRGTQTVVPGRVVADTINTGIRTTLTQGGHTEWQYTALSFGSPLTVGSQIRCRPLRESGAAFDSYANVKTLTFVAPPQTVVIKGTVLKGVTIQ